GGQLWWEPVTELLPPATFPGVFSNPRQLVELGAGDPAEGEDRDNVAGVAHAGAGEHAAHLGFRPVQPLRDHRLAEALHLGGPGHRQTQLARPYRRSFFAHAATVELPGVPTG